MAKTVARKAGVKKASTAKKRVTKKAGAKTKVAKKPARKTTRAQLKLHVVGLGLFVARKGKPIQVLLPNADLHAGHGHIEEHELWIAYRAAQVDTRTAPVPASDRKWPDNARLRARRITARASIDFTGLVNPGPVKLPAGLIDIADLTGGKRAASSLLDAPTVAHEGVRGRITLPGGVGKVDARGGKWRAKGVGRPFRLHPGADWTMTLRIGTSLTLQIRDLEKPGILTTLPTLLPKGRAIELWVFHVPKHEADGHGTSSEPGDGAPAGHFPAFYVMPDLDSGAKPTPTYYKPRKASTTKKAPTSRRPELVYGINPFTCMVGGDDGEP